MTDQKENKNEDIKEEIKRGIISELRKEDDSPGGLFIPAGVLAGIGFGFLFNNLPAGLFIGLGFGFVAFAIYEIYRQHVID